MKRGSSTRLIEAPRTSVVMVDSLSVVSAGRDSTRPERGCRLADRRHDVLVARAAAQVALDAVADLVVRGIRVARQLIRGRHDHARRAEAALQTVLLPERVLDGVQATLGSHALDRDDDATVGLDGQDGARFDCVPVQPDGARAALAGVAAHVGPGQAQVLADGMDQDLSGLERELMGDSVDRQPDLLSHLACPPCGRARYGAGDTQRWSANAGTPRAGWQPESQPGPPAATTGSAAGLARRPTDEPDGCEGHRPDHEVIGDEPQERVTARSTRSVDRDEQAHRKDHGQADDDGRTHPGELGLDRGLLPGLDDPGRFTQLLDLAPGHRPLEAGQAAGRRDADPFVATS